MTEVKAPGGVTWVSWPLRDFQGQGCRRRAAVRGWIPGGEDPLDEATGEPRVWEAGHVRAWIREAMEILHRLPMPRDGLPSRLRSHMPAVLQDVAEAYGYQGKTSRKGASAAEIERMDKVLDWLLRLRDRQEATVVTAAALGLSFRAIGKLVGRSHEWCRQKERTAIERLADELNKRQSRGDSTNGQPAYTRATHVLSAADKLL